MKSLETVKECTCTHDTYTDAIARFTPTCPVHGAGRHCVDCGDELKPHEARRCTSCNVAKHLG